MASVTLSRDGTVVRTVEYPSGQFHSAIVKDKNNKTVDPASSQQQSTAPAPDYDEDVLPLLVFSATALRACTAMGYTRSSR